MQEKDRLDRPVLPDQFYPVPELKQYIHLGIVRQYAKDSAVVLPGESNSSMIYVVSGRLRVNMITDDGREKLIYIAQPYTILGRLFISDVNDFHIVVLEDSELCFFDKDQLKVIFRQDEELIFEVLKNYTSKVSYFMGQIKYLDAYSPTIRIYRLLYDLNNQKGKLVGNTYEVECSLSQKNISELTGAHYVTVSKVLGSLKKKEIAQKTRNMIYIYDLEKLKKLIDNPEYD